VGEDRTAGLVEANRVLKRLIDERAELAVRHILLDDIEIVVASAPQTAVQPERLHGISNTTVEAGEQQIPAFG
jgi:hypothetical protein